MTQEEKSIALYERIKPLLESGEPMEIHPSGTSMYPLLTGKDYVILQPLGKEDSPRKNDVLLYRRASGLLVLHRLCRIGEEGYYFVGDNQTEVEGPLQREVILAVVTDICRHGRWFSAKNLIYRFFSRTWLFLRPIRPLISRPLGKVYRFFRKK